MYCTQVRRVSRTLDYGRKFSLKLTQKQWKRCTVHQVRHFNWFFTITSKCNISKTHSVLFRCNNYFFFTNLVQKLEAY